MPTEDNGLDRVGVRDRRAPGFHIVDNELYEVFGPTIGVYGLAVYGALAMLAGQGGRCEPSVAELAGMLGIGARKVRETIARLAELRLIEVVRRPMADKSNATNVYTLLPVAKKARSTGGASLGEVGVRSVGRHPYAPTGSTLRSDVQGVFQEEGTRKEQEIEQTQGLSGQLAMAGIPDAPEPAPAGGAADVPSAPKWQVFYDAVAEGTGAELYLQRANGGRPAGSLHSWVGKLSGAVGTAVASHGGNKSDVQVALRVLSAWLALDQYRPSNPVEFSVRFTAWAGQNGTVVARAVWDQDVAVDPERERVAKLWDAAY